MTGSQVNIIETLQLINTASGCFNFGQIVRFVQIPMKAAASPWGWSGAIRSDWANARTSNVIGLRKEQTGQTIYVVADMVNSDPDLVFGIHLKSR